MFGYRISQWTSHVPRSTNLGCPLSLVKLNTSKLNRNRWVGSCPLFSHVSGSPFSTNLDILCKSIHSTVNTWNLSTRACPSFHFPFLAFWQLYKGTCTEDMCPRLNLHDDGGSNSHRKSPPSSSQQGRCSQHQKQPIAIVSVKRIRVEDIKATAPPKKAFCESSRCPGHAHRDSTESIYTTSPLLTPYQYTRNRDILQNSTKWRMQFTLWVIIIYTSWPSGSIDHGAHSIIHKVTGE
jgi:hypothetical protein